MREWHYLSNEQQWGPLPEVDLIEFLRERRLPPETMVWSEGMDNWVPANQIDSLFMQIQRSAPQTRRSAPAPVSRSTIQPHSRTASFGISAAKTDLSPKERRSILQRREWTYLLDIVLIQVLCFGVGLILGVAMSGNASNQSIQETATLLGFGVIVVCVLFKDSFSGKSLGKSMTGLRVIDSSTGRPIGPLKSVARNWIFLIPLFPLVELIVAGSREDKRRLGDLMANTVVVKD